MPAHDFREVASGFTHRNRPDFTQVIQHPHMPDNAQPQPVRILGTMYYAARSGQGEMLEGGCVRMCFQSGNSELFSVWFRQAPDNYVDIWSSCDNGPEAEFFKEQEHYEIYYRDNLTNEAELYRSTKIPEVNESFEELMEDESHTSESEESNIRRLQDETAARRLEILINALATKVEEAFGEDEVIGIFDRAGVEIESPDGDDSYNWLGSDE